jgi:hypothetical protein
MSNGGLEFDGDYLRPTSHAQKIAIWMDGKIGK